MKLMLVGTAQWGQDYGITNSQGRLPDRALNELVKALRARGLDYLDTAPGYGDAESRIGRFGQGFEIQTKISASGRSSADLESTLIQSFRALKVETIHSVLVHDWHLLMNHEKTGVANFLAEAKSRGLIEKVGISGYDEVDVDSALLIFDVLDVAQVPANAIDQRLNTSTVISRFRTGGGKVQARSLLLQGLLISDPSDWGKALTDGVAKFRHLADVYGRSRLEFAFDYIKSQNWIDEVVIAPTSVTELGEICEAWESSTPEGVDWSSLASSDLELIDPRRWV